MFFKFFIIGLTINTIQFSLYYTNKTLYVVLHITIISYLLTYHLLY